MSGGSETVPLRTFALTPGQRLLWDDLAHGDSSSDLNIGGLVIIPGELDVAGFYRALARMLAVHDAFSVTLVRDPEGSVPRQRFEPQKPMIEVVDLSAEADPTEAVHERARRLMNTAIDSFGHRLYRSQLVRLGAAGTAWIFVANHMIADGWSMAIFVDHVLRAYAADSTGGCFEPEVESFVQWASAGPERAPGHGHHGDPDRDGAYWDERLGAGAKPLFTPVEHHGRTTGHTTVGTVTGRISSSLHERMVAFGAEHRTRPLCLIQTALGVVLSEAQQTTGWTMTLASSNRSSPRLRRMSGQHAGVHPFPWEFGTEASMGELLGQVRRRIRQDYRWLPFEGTAGHRQQVVGLGVRFNSYPFDFLISEIAGRPVTILPLRSESPVGPLEVIFVDLGERRERTITFNYDPRVLCAWQVESIKDAVLDLIDAVLRRPEASIAELAVEYPRPVVGVEPAAQSSG